jgi:TPR repeat protein
LTASRLIDSINKKNPAEDFKQLKKAADEGSLFAMVSVALCYDRGLGIKKSLTDAVKYFRLAAQRGNRFAYDELKRIYDEKRPEDSEFSISN